MPFLPHLLRTDSNGRRPARPLPGHAFAVAVVALLLAALSGEVRAALGGLMAQVDEVRDMVVQR
ncbi:hypothetical protein JHL17_09605 [Azospirillum sp. YIM B02556]|uniref:Uncharacterized protein n=1 Tax=Azospirillum endophyticum TaxID=2800326 RepID=A0ABS1F2L5_9PROT|nr:hypothetical protein [Azospirillum endophyticum]MBK1837670.1 hypothetical protein [Azospirillum endophyticum]